MSSAARDLAGVRLRRRHRPAILFGLGALAFTMTASAQASFPTTSGWGIMTDRAGQDITPPPAPPNLDPGPLRPPSGVDAATGAGQVDAPSPSDFDGGGPWTSSEDPMADPLPADREGPTVKIPF